MECKFKIGSRVQLISGGYIMTVGSISRNMVNGVIGPGYIITCYYQTGGKQPKMETFTGHEDMFKEVGDIKYGLFTW
jgi:uncharacterized protein YodC (DUF2158 family)